MNLKKAAIVSVLFFFPATGQNAELQTIEKNIFKGCLDNKYSVSDDKKLAYCKCISTSVTSKMSIKEIEFFEKTVQGKGDNSDDEARVKAKFFDLMTACATKIMQ